MSEFEAMRDAMGIEPLEILKRDPREAFLSHEFDGFEYQEVKASEGPVCILCESGYHDHAWEITHIMQCGCPCHVKRSAAIAG